MPPPQIVRESVEQFPDIESERVVVAIRRAAGRRMNAPLRRRVGDISVSETLAKHAQEQVIVFVPAQALIEAADRFERGAADQRRGWLNDNPVSKNRMKVALRVFQTRMFNVPPADHFPVMVDVVKVAVDPAQRRSLVFLEHPHKQCQVSRMPY